MVDTQNRIRTEKFAKRKHEIGSRDKNALIISVKVISDQASDDASHSGGKSGDLRAHLLDNFIGKF